MSVLETLPSSQKVAEPSDGRIHRDLFRWLGRLSAVVRTALASPDGYAVVADNGAVPTKAPARIAPSAEPTGPNRIGDVYVTLAGVMKICTVAGTPGTWVSVGAQ